MWCAHREQEAALLQGSHPARIARPVAALVGLEHGDQERAEDADGEDRVRREGRDRPSQPRCAAATTGPVRISEIHDSVPASWKKLDVEDPVRVDVVLADLQHHAAEERDLFVEPGVERPVQQAGDEVGDVDTGEDREKHSRARTAGTVQVANSQTRPPSSTAPLSTAPARWKRSSLGE